MRISRAQLLHKYGVDLPVGKFSVCNDGVKYINSKVRDDTEGCLLVGSTHSEDFVGNSRATFAKLFELIESAYDKGDEITLEIK